MNYALLQPAGEETPSPPSDVSSAAQLLPATSILIAILALVFTVSSFWWLNARTGRLRSFPPQSFAAFVQQPLQRTGIRLPLVFHNTGAAPIVVRDLRLAFLDAADSKPLHWANTRDRLRPVSDDYTDLPAVFSVSGRATERVFAEFQGEFPGGLPPEAREYRVAVEARLGHKRGWHRVVTFQLQAGNITSPTSYIAYSNDPNFLDAERKRAARAALERVRKQAREVAERRKMDKREGDSAE